MLAFSINPESALYVMNMLPICKKSEYDWASTLLGSTFRILLHAQPMWLAALNRTTSGEAIPPKKVRCSDTIGLVIQSPRLILVSAHLMAFRCQSPGCRTFTHPE